MKKILYFLLHGEVCINRVDNVLNTWGQNVDIVFYSDYENINKKVYKVTDKKGYWDLEEKHVNGFKFLKNNFTDYDWYFFCDDDTFVNTKKMNEFLQICDENTVYGYLLSGWPVMTSLHYPSGGGGVLIHKTILEKIIDKIRVRNTGFADITLGLTLFDENIKTVNCEFLHSEHPNHFGISYENIKEHITFHHIPTYEEMKKLNDMCN
jgi:hypothetical protein